MTVVWVLLTIYVVSALACAAISWAEYKDRTPYFVQRQKEKILKLYIIPLCPIVNTMTMVVEIFNYVA